MKRHSLTTDARSLEENFFARENTKLLERLREKTEREQRREALHTVVRNADDELLDHLIELGVGPETALAVMLVPLVAVAWADGSMADKEREAILRAARDRGVETSDPAHDLLTSWLEEEPSPRLIEMWRRYVRAVGAELPPDERDQLRDGMLGFARGVAEAAGGFLGLGKKISEAEQAVLDDVAAALS